MVKNKEQYIWNFIFTVVFIALAAILTGFLYSKNKVFPISYFDFLLLALAIFRLTHLFVYDHITDYIRDYFEKFEKGPRKTISVMIHCPWCTGIWIALTVSTFYFLFPFSWYLIFVFALAGIGTLVEEIGLRIMR
ncbi:MAG: DUF1360 domain-containing protein [Patescibacteria group bacterium]